jgi:DNA-binding NarL/FixJ family response regulator
MTVRVLVADGDVLVRTALVALVRGVPGLEVAGEAADGDAAAAAARSDVALVDDGLTPSIPRLLATAAPPRVLVLADAPGECAYLALAAGAAGVLRKGSPPERIIAALHTVAAADTLVEPDETRRLAAAHARGRHATAVGPAELAALTGQETAVLRALGDGLPDARIARRACVPEPEVRAHVARVLAKLGLRSRAQALVVAHENGLPDRRP